MKATPSMRARDAGLAQISRINRWMVAGAVALSGLISLVASNSFHGRTLSSASQRQPQSSSAGSASSSAAGSSSSAGLQQPAAAPAASVPTPVPSSPVVTGGS